MAVLPDKWIRKAVFDRIHRLGVDFDGEEITIPCYDTIVPEKGKNHYVLMTTQTNTEVPNKCGNGWLSSILLNVVTRYPNTGNTGSRLLADDIANEILTELNDISLDAASGLVIQTKTIDFPNDISSLTESENIFRKLIRYEFIIN